LTGDGGGGGGGGFVWRLVGSQTIAVIGTMISES